MIQVDAVSYIFSTIFIGAIWYFIGKHRGKEEMRDKFRRAGQ